MTSRQEPDGAPKITRKSVAPRLNVDGSKAVMMQHPVGLLVIGVLVLARGVAGVVRAAQ